ncbi:hypothetical protein PIROE2DRAFT_19337 [Piromyces sp. E2]|nr:hypothetical protein PIROE2DRAFT_19337 [Piromyces sp. E2]|eukprot:OUM56177.1 hypothetical protein PIROE2DRAFT_19337 [Piromyces sp. E2]
MLLNKRSSTCEPNIISYVIYTTATKHHIQLQIPIDLNEENLRTSIPENIGELTELTYM